jgi:RNA polymerase sigma-70 factor (ECF subfamily)
MAKVDVAAIYREVGASGAAADPDVALMMALKAGDETAFSELVERHQSRIITLIYRFVGNEAEAEDLAQEVFLRVYRTRQRYEPRATFSTWLYRIAANMSLNALRSRSRRRNINVPLTYDAQETQEGQTSAHVEDLKARPPSARIEDEELRGQIREAIDQLPESQKVAVILNKYEGMSYDDIGSIMGCSVMAVKSLLARARSNLHDRLEHYIATGRVRRNTSPTQ